MDDDLWALIEPLLPLRPERSPGPKPVDDRLCLQGILYVLNQNIAWQLLFLELEFGSGQAMLEESGSLAEGRSLREVAWEPALGVEGGLRTRLDPCVRGRFPRPRGGAAESPLPAPPGTDRDPPLPHATNESPSSRCWRPPKARDPPSQRPAPTSSPCAATELSTPLTLLHQATGSFGVFESVADVVPHQGVLPALAALSPPSSERQSLSPGRSSESDSAQRHSRPGTPTGRCSHSSTTHAHASPSPDSSSVRFTITKALMVVHLEVAGHGAGVTVLQGTRADRGRVSVL
ncbi:transposase [Streptomyces sp. NPDC005349]|uniref:transposase n=1 Tax=Streptomyces sp. NPDC005349 TaxID=3157037 RepID=UPI0033A0EBE6